MPTGTVYSLSSPALAASRLRSAIACCPASGTKAWAQAKSKAFNLNLRMEIDATSLRDLTARAGEAVPLPGRYGNDAEAIRQDITSETMRDRKNSAAVDRLEGALASLPA